MDKYNVTFETWNKIASIYQDKFMDLDLYNDTYDRFCELLEMPNAKILEIGCGPGNITKYLLVKHPDYLIEGIDMAPNMIELAQKNNPTAGFKVMDCRDIDKINTKFNAIMCGFCIPYLSKEDCEKLIKDSANLLNTNGIVYYSMIEGNYSKSGFEAGSTGDQSYVYYHSEDHFREHLMANGFEMMDVFRKHYTRSDGSESVHLIILAKKK